MDKQKINRINELAHKSKTIGLDANEAAEQATLRAEYIADFRAGLRGQLDNTVIVRPDGSRERLSPKCRTK